MGSFSKEELSVSFEEIFQLLQEQNDKGIFIVGLEIVR